MLDYSFGDYMIKRLALTVMCLALVCITVFAHGGNTDANGGHTNSSTGEYHYHHGYPAHQHTDIDGDGDIDCPYDFDDKTGWLNGSNGSDVKEVIKEVEVVKEVEVIKEVVPKRTKTLISALTAALVLVAVIGVPIIIEQRDTIVKAEAAKQKAEADSAKLKSELRMNLEKYLGEEYLLKLSKAPRSVSIGKDGFPYDADTLANFKWGESCTYFVARGSYNKGYGNYHMMNCRYSGAKWEKREVNFVEVIDNPNFKACDVCGSHDHPHLEWQKKYMKLKHLLDA